MGDEGRERIMVNEEQCTQNNDSDVVPSRVGRERTCVNSVAGVKESAGL